LGFLQNFVLCVERASSRILVRSLEQFGQLVRDVVTGNVMDLNHGRLDAPVAHVGLDVGQGHDLDPQGAERMEKVMDSHVRQSSSFKCLLEAAAKGALLDVRSGR